MSIDLIRAQSRILGQHSPTVEEPRLEAWRALRPRLVAALHPLNVEVIEAVHDALLALVSADVLTLEQRRALAGPCAAVLTDLLEAEAPAVRKLEALS